MSKSRIACHRSKDAVEDDLGLQFEDWLRSITATPQELAALVRTPQYTMHEIRQRLAQSRVAENEKQSARKIRYFHDQIGQAPTRTTRAPSQGSNGAATLK
jgi:hypothetical protein